MDIRKKFVIFFTIFILIITSILGYIGYSFIKSEVDLFINAPNKDYVAIMADELLFRSAVSFISLLVLVTLISIATGLILFRSISKSYLRSVQKVTGLASSRIIAKDLKTDVELLEKYIEIAIEDQKKLKDFEKINSWKEGARLLIHEIKNPLTPLKLSLENMLIKDIKECEGDLHPALTSAKDIENILSSFKDLVNINYESLGVFDFGRFYDKARRQLKLTYPGISFIKDLKGEVINVFSEPKLLKILITNLINNAFEANPNGVFVDFIEGKDKLTLSFITQNSHIESIERIFVPGYSSKGKGRGYGLFLCKMISDYLGANIKAQNISGDVVFTININKGEMN